MYSPMTQSFELSQTSSARLRFRLCDLHVGDDRAALDRDANFFAVLDRALGARALAGGGVDQLHIRDVNRTILFDDAAFGIARRGLLVTLHPAHTLDDHTIVLGEDAGHGAD